MPEKKPERVVFTLPAETRARLTALDSDLIKTRAALETMKKMGMDVSSMEEKIKWAEDARKLMLEEFG
jgi:hypothetical protein